MNLVNIYTLLSSANWIYFLKVCLTSYLKHPGPKLPKKKYFENIY